MAIGHMSRPKGVWKFRNRRGLFSEVPMETKPPSFSARLASSATAASTTSPWRAPSAVSNSALVRRSLVPLTDGTAAVRPRTTG